MLQKNILLSLTLVLTLTNLTHAQKHRSQLERGARTTLLDSKEGDYDVKYLRFDLHVTDTSVYLWGNVTTNAQIIVSSTDKYVFELDTLMIIDSAKINGIVLPVATAGFVRTISLTGTLHSGDNFTAQIFYHGTQPSGSGFYSGVTHDVSSGGTQMVYTNSDPWVALDWWPCKQSVDDKIDSVDMFVTVPQGVKDGSNGVLVGVDTASSPGYWTYHWQTHYPITYYLISMAIAKYSEYKSYMHFSGSSDSMLIQNFFYDTATFNPVYKSNFDSIGLMIDYFSSIFGRYPFWKEKYGVCYATLYGGVEHQTMTTIGLGDTYIIAHELCHQWFGDHVSFARWGDVWLSEGFATFSENLFYSKFWNAQAALALRKDLLTTALSQPCGQIYVTDTSGPNTLFFQPTVYDKAALVINTLRYLGPNDSTFFSILKTYQSTYGFSNASTQDFKTIAEGIYGFSLDTFFNQWIYGKGYPVYRLNWNQIGTKVFVKLIQTRSCISYNTTFKTPLELQLKSATSDTIIRVYNNADTQEYSFDWSGVVDTIYFNPDVWTVCKLLGPVKKDTKLGVNNIKQLDVIIYPNPSGDYWWVEQLPINAQLILTDAAGRCVWESVTESNKTKIPCENLPPGEYYLSIGQNNAIIKLVHW
jgi:aminopeptidase N